MQSQYANAGAVRRPRFRVQTRARSLRRHSDSLLSTEMDTIESAMSHPPTVRRRVLVVDDNADLALLLGEVIRADEALEYVGDVRSGAEAIEKARLGAADVFVLDLSLRDASGFQILERLTNEAPAVKVIIHTGHDFEGLGDILKRSGAAGYVVKDGNPEKLLSAIRSA